MQTRPQTYSNRYNQPQIFFELISDKEQVKTIIEDIKADKSINIEIERFIYQTNFYPDLETKLKSQRAELAKIDDYTERLKLNEDIQATENEIKTYKIGILETSSTLYDLREESLTEVKKTFFVGNILQANTQLNSHDLWQVQVLLLQKLEIDKKLEEVYEKLVDNAMEYLVKAQLSALNLEILDFDDRIQKAIEFFEKGSISAEKSRKEEFIGDYHFEYALFLQRNNLFNRATEIYQITLKIRQALAQTNLAQHLLDMADTLNNIGILHRSTNEIKASKVAFTKTLAIKRKLSKQNPSVYLPNMAITLHNLANLHYATNKTEVSAQEFQKALKIRRKLARQNPSIYLPHVASTLNNLIALYRSINKIDASRQAGWEALEIRRTLARQNPAVLADVADTLNNLAILHRATDEIDSSEQVYLEALAIYRPLARKAPSVYLPALAVNLMNLAIFYLESKPNRVTSLTYIKEAIPIFDSFLPSAPYLEKHVETSQLLLIHWGISKEDLFKEDNKIGKLFKRFF